MSSDRSDGEKENCENERPNSPASESGSEQFNHEESRLIVAMENAISQQKAAFCCGWSGAPATLGKEGEEVLDESYRKAVKLDCNQFSTSFSSYEVGTIDAIAQNLLPGIAKPFSGRKSKYEEHLGEIAEFYKLNVSLPTTFMPKKPALQRFQSP